ncbi:MAG: GspE/PulE family protein [Fusobacteriaceae bacterium]
MLKDKPNNLKSDNIPTKSAPINKAKLDSILSELKNSKMDTLSSKENTDIAFNVEESLSNDSPLIVKGFSAILVGAVNVGATDIHIEAFEKEVRIRYRIDGELNTIKTIDKSVLNALVSRVKILSNLDISERRLPQDGRMKARIMDRDIDFRVAIMPTIFGEKVVIRILDKGTVDMRIDKIGFTEDEYNKVLKCITAPHGIILVTGPTGSGKSTTLYSILNYLNTENVNISTVEDPVEYNIDGINQVQAKPDIGLTFAAALREFLRQDPDIIMLGEIRDSETSEIAIKAALTGHLVLSTLHTNDAPSTINRLMNMGIEPFLISATVLLIISQRLVRKICPDCKIVDENYLAKAMALGLKEKEYKDKTFYTHAPEGCPTCNGTGYKGRIAVHEILVLNDAIKDLIDKRASTSEIFNVAVANGMAPLREEGLLCASEGVTSLDELLKIIH